MDVCVFNEIEILSDSTDDVSLIIGFKPDPDCLVKRREWRVHWLLPSSKEILVEHAAQVGRCLASGVSLLGVCVSASVDKSGKKSASSSTSFSSSPPSWLVDTMIPILAAQAIERELLAVVRLTNKKASASLLSIGDNGLVSNRTDLKIIKPSGPMKLMEIRCALPLDLRAPLPKLQPNVTGQSSSSSSSRLRTCLQNEISHLKLTMINAATMVEIVEDTESDHKLVSATSLKPCSCLVNSSSSSNTSSSSSNSSNNSNWQIIMIRFLFALDSLTSASSSSSSLSSVGSVSMKGLVDARCLVPQDYSIKFAISKLKADIDFSLTGRLDDLTKELNLAVKANQSERQLLNPFAEDWAPTSSLSSVAWTLPLRRFYRPAAAATATITPSSGNNNAKKSKKTQQHLRLAPLLFDNLYPIESLSDSFARLVDVFDGIIDEQHDSTDFYYPSVENFALNQSFPSPVVVGGGEDKGKEKEKKQRTQQQQTQQQQGNSSPAPAQRLSSILPAIVIAFIAIFIMFLWDLI